MTIDEALRQACAAVGVREPKGRAVGRWMKTDTDGKHGKGDGRVIVNEKSVTAWNWQTGQKSTVWTSNKMDLRERRELSREIEETKRKSALAALRATALAEALIREARPAQHPYLIAKGFRDEEALVVGATFVRETAGAYLVPAKGSQAIVLPLRRAGKVTNVQLIWEDGTKKFLFGGETGGACHRIATGVDTWLCEGYATGLSVRAALRSMKVKPTILCCLSASNIVTIARECDRRVFIATDNDKPMPQFDGLGTGEYYSRLADRPYGMPPGVGTDFNDMHLKSGIFAVQRVLTSVMAMRRAA